MAGEDPKPKGYSRCPICGEATDMAFRPFCSKRCRDVDLARWLGDGYAIAGGSADADEDGDDDAAAGGRGGASTADDDLP